MKKTNLSKPVDSVGRIVLPAKLRKKLGLKHKDVLEFFIHEEHDKVYLCMECPSAKAEIHRAIEMLEESGYKVL